MNTFKHSGAFGDLIYSLSLVQHLGGGEFHIHLDQINWIGQHYYGSRPDPVHQGRLNAKDVESLTPLLEAQPYIDSVKVYDGRSEITHNLDRFRRLFVGHPGNYLDIYAWAFGIQDPMVLKEIRTRPWLSVPNVRRIAPIVINRTERWLPKTLDPAWHSPELRKDAVFIGHPHEHRKFCRDMNWPIDYHPTETLLDMAEVIAGADLFCGNQSSALSLAIGLGQTYHCELRDDLPKLRNECYIPDHPNSLYFG